MRVCLSLILALAAGAVLAAPDSPEPLMLKWLNETLARSFVLPAEPALDPALRSAADDIGAAHLKRIGALLPAWMEEERQRQGRDGKPVDNDALFSAVWARLLNELALWQLEPGDAAYESATLAALTSTPSVCAPDTDSRYTDFAVRITRIQAMPAAQQSAALATERALLAHWGQPRSAPPPWPEPLPQDAAAALLKSGKERPALPPVLAAELLVDKKIYAALHPTSRCLLQQWWLRHSLQQGVAPAAALNAFRYGTLIGASERLVGMYETAPADGKPAAAPAAGRPPYPGIATHFMAHGATIAQVKLDANGKPQQASVIGRKVEVPGIRDARPVAFENVFDAATLKYAMESYQYPKPPGAAPFKFQLQWTMEGASR